MHAKIVVHTDVFLDYVQHSRKGKPSLLRVATGRYLCYATVFTAIELFSLAVTREEEHAIERSMAAVKLLGLNARSAKLHGKLLSSGIRLPRANLLIAGICLESKLPILTMQPNEFRGVKQLQVIPATSLRE